MDKKSIITIRLKPDQELILQEVSDVLNVPKSVFIRAVIGDWLTKNEDALYRLIDKRLNKEENESEDTDFFAGVFQNDD